MIVKTGGRAGREGAILAQAGNAVRTRKPVASRQSRARHHARNIVIECEAMRRGNTLAWALTILCTLGMVQWAAAQDDEPTSAMHFMVIRDYNGKPIANAAVILHPVTTKGKQSKGGMELKTDHEGQTRFDGIPYGTLRVQVIAQGFQTFGEDYDVNKPAIDVTIKLKRPQGQYSVYEPKKDEAKPDEKKADEGKPDEKKPQ
jgi:hypothetical protein